MVIRMEARSSWLSNRETCDFEGSLAVFLPNLKRMRILMFLLKIVVSCTEMMMGKTSRDQISQFFYRRLLCVVESMCHR